MIYERIASNKRNSVLLAFLFFAIVAALGFALGALFQSGYMGVIIAVIISVTMISFSYFMGDQAVLAINRATPASKKEYPQLVNIVEGLSIASGLPKPKVYVIDDKSINAFATGRDPKHASIAVTTGALEKLNREELEGVVSHEMSHVKNYDVRFMTLVAILVGVVAILANIFLRSMWWSGPNRRDREGGNQIQIIFVLVGLVLAILAPLAAQLIKFAISRKREFLADAEGALLTRYPKGLANALRKIEKDSNILKDASPAMEHMYIANPFKKPNWFSNLFSTHPPIEERIKALESM
ncbi:zinc metalloprotease HtpX [Candidatus Woesearchaeota archaeon CG07_land_8_20_14_0_80_44_23]|jgi:heat shock protein HtpX|nr:MAG: zinc metalloprotease HtpX [Candidatus Woesearchaeota archaeon CG07_land_8_20_14_0_80_44_23]